MKYGWAEIDPFAPDTPESYLALHPFKRVPALQHDDFHVYETGAITRYVDETFAGPPLQPGDPRERARCNQIISVADSYAYWPLVRQVFAHRIFRPHFSQPADNDEAKKGMEAAPKILAALERLAGESAYLCGNRLTLADIHLAPMIAYFAMAAEGATLLSRQPKLSAWWSTTSARPAFQATKPRLPV